MPLYLLWVPSLIFFLLLIFFSPYPLLSPPPAAAATTAASLLLPPSLPPFTHTQAAYPHVAKIYSHAIPTIVTLLLMTIASTWLLLHAASQWARTRTEAKLLHRIPHAAKHALAMQQSRQLHMGGGAGAGGSAAGGDSEENGGGRLSGGGGLFGGKGGKGRATTSSSGGGSSAADASAPAMTAASDGGGAVGLDVPAKQQPAPLASV